jgi:hypothetical protein
VVKTLRTEMPEIVDLLKSGGRQIA